MLRCSFFVVFVRMHASKDRSIVVATLCAGQFGQKGFIYKKQDLLIPHPKKTLKRTRERGRKGKQAESLTLNAEERFGHSALR